MILKTLDQQLDDNLYAEISVNTTTYLEKFLKFCSLEYSIAGGKKVMLVNRKEVRK